MNQTNKEGLISYLLMDGKKVNESWETLSKTFGFNSGESARNCWKAYRNNHLNKTQIDNHYEKALDIIEEFEQKINTEKGTASTTFLSSKEVLTVDEIYKECKMDPTKWVMTQIWHKKRAMGFVYSADFKLKDKEDELLPKLLDNYKTSYKPIDEKDFIQNNKYENPTCMVLSLPDLHLDKLTVDLVTAEQSVKNYEAVLEKLLYKCYSSHFIDEIVFVLGNDFYHTDSLHNTTTKGTPLFVNTEWDKAYEMGFELLIKCISKVKQFCNKLRIILIPGNHSVTKEFYLAHGLEMYFKSDKNITFDRSKLDQKVYKYGETLLCFSHGNNVNDKLPLVFSTTFYKEWGECKYKEIILGDKHHNTEKLFSSQGESNGIRMRILPSLSGTDQWHQDNLFVNAIQSGIALVYDYKKGKCSEFEERI